MTPNLRYPNITGRTPEEQIDQLKRYLYQLIDQLNYVLETIETKNNPKKEGK